MSLLSRQQIIDAADINTLDIACPEWGGEVRIRSLTLKEADAWRKSLMRETEVREGRNVRKDLSFDKDKAVENEVNLIVMAAIDDNGQKVFQVEDVAALMKKHTAPIKRLVEAITKLSGIYAAAVDDAEKNS